MQQRKKTRSLSPFWTLEPSCFYSARPFSISSLLGTLLLCGLFLSLGQALHAEQIPEALFTKRAHRFEGTGRECDNGARKARLTVDYELNLAMRQPKNLEEFRIECLITDMYLTKFGQSYFFSREDDTVVHLLTAPVSLVLYLKKTPQGHVGLWESSPAWSDLNAFSNWQVEPFPVAKETLRSLANPLSIFRSALFTSLGHLYQFEDYSKDARGLFVYQASTAGGSPEIKVNASCHEDNALETYLVRKTRRPGFFYGTICSFEEIITPLGKR